MKDIDGFNSGKAQSRARGVAWKDGYKNMRLRSAVTFSYNILLLF